MLVPRLELVSNPSVRPLEPEEVDARDLADLLEGEQRRQNRGSWFTIPALFAASALVLLGVSAPMQILGAVLLAGASWGNLWLVRSALDRECAELGVSSTSLRKVLRRVYKEHARTTLRGLTGSARQRKIAELVREGGRKRPRQLAAFPSPAR